MPCVLYYLFFQNKNDDLENENERESRLTIRSRNLTSTSILLMNKQKLHFLFFFFGIFPFHLLFGLNWKSKKESVELCTLRIRRGAGSFPLAMAALAQQWRPNVKEDECENVRRKGRTRSLGSRTKFLYVPWKTAERWFIMSRWILRLSFSQFFTRLVRGKIEIG